MLSEKIEYNLNQIKETIIGKKVFIFDLETTGLFDKKSFYKYWDNTVFDSSRIVEIGYYYSENFGLDFESNNIIHSYLRRPTDFDTIHPKAQEKHGISIEKLKSDGFTFSRILNYDLIHKLNSCEIIISHNTLFDFYILLNELNRFKLSSTIQYLLSIKTTNNLICTCRASGYKKLDYLYRCIFNQDPQISHRAGEDVLTLIEIIIKKKLNLNYKLIII
jgi:DNA polymerase III epsilon subunit-like protein